MIKKDTIFDFMTNVMMIFGVSVMCLLLFTFIFGENAKAVSTIFALGNKGIALQTLLQFFVSSFLITVLEWMFFTDKIFKKMSLAVRFVLTFFSIVILIAVFATIFRWFPVNMVLPWVMFLICFAVCATVSVVLSVLKEKRDNAKLQNALELLKGEDE
ncbi:MAG: hypothetical protein E7288_09760 [Lachnospiraceae bacterium]|nr:hypothetical protein [Lachnospiraceae bacterium]